MDRPLDLCVLCNLQRRERASQRGSRSSERERADERERASVWPGYPKSVPAVTRFSRTEERLLGSISGSVTGGVRCTRLQTSPAQRSPRPDRAGDVRAHGLEARGLGLWLLVSVLSLFSLSLSLSLSFFVGVCTLTGS